MSLELNLTMTMLHRRTVLRSAARALMTGTGWPLSALGTPGVKPSSASVLIVVDVRNCFMPGGTLPINKGEEVVPVINRIAGAFRNVVLPHDWHTREHQSSVNNHLGMKVFETIDLSYGTQVLWPSHCVQGTADAALHKGLSIPHAQVVVRKGFDPRLDNYSTLREADRKTHSGLTRHLKERDIQNVYECGLATDFCVAWTALGAQEMGFQTFVIEDASRSIDLNGSLAAAWKQMAAKGVKRMQSAEMRCLEPPPFPTRPIPVHLFTDLKDAALQCPRSRRSKTVNRFNALHTKRLRPC